MEIIDLSRVITNGMHAHVTTTIAPLVRIGEAVGRFQPPCEGFNANLLVMSDHCGTHLDAPSHFIREGATIDRIPLSRLVGPAVVCDVSAGHGDLVERGELVQEVHAMQPRVRPAGFLLLKTRAQPDRPGKGLSKGAAEFLVELGVGLVGTDDVGIDIGRNRDRPGHMTLLGTNVLVVESLVNLQRLVGREVLLVVLPLALAGGSGSPVRPIAIYPYLEANWPVLDRLQPDHRACS